MKLRKKQKKSFLVDNNQYELRTKSNQYEVRTTMFPLDGSLFDTRNILPAVICFLPLDLFIRSAFQIKSFSVEISEVRKYLLN